jgi:hypothetical protein
METVTTALRCKGPPTISLDNSTCNNHLPDVSVRKLSVRTLPPALLLFDAAFPEGEELIDEEFPSPLVHAGNVVVAFPTVTPHSWFSR